MTETLTAILDSVPRWVINLGFWLGLVVMIAACVGVLWSYRGMRQEMNGAINDVYDFLDELKAEREGAVRPLSAPLRLPDNVRDIPTTRTAVARTDEAVEGLKATLGMPTDPDKLTAVHTITTVPTAGGLDARVPAPDTRVPAPDVPNTNAIPAQRPDDPGRIAANVTPSGWAFVLSPEHKIEHVDGEVVPAFRDPQDTPSAEQLEAPTNPDLEAQPGQHLSGATRLDLALAIHGRHRAPDDA